MKNKNKSNLFLAVIKRVKVKNRSLKKELAYKKLISYDIVLVDLKKKHKTGFVLEKLGVYSLKDKKILIDVFRIIYWISFKIGFTSSAWKLMSNFFFLKTWYDKRFK